MTTVRFQPNDAEKIALKDGGFIRATIDFIPGPQAREDLSDGLINVATLDIGEHGLGGPINATVTVVPPPTPESCNDDAEPAAPFATMTPHDVALCGAVHALLSRFIDTASSKELRSKLWTAWNALPPAQENGLEICSLNEANVQQEHDEAIEEAQRAALHLGFKAGFAYGAALGG